MQLDHPKRKRKLFLLLAIFLLILTGATFTTLNYHQLFPSEFDETSQENYKLVSILNDVIEEQIDLNTKSNDRSNLSEQSRSNTISFIQSLTEIRTYARHGVKSKRKRNHLLIEAHFLSGKVVDDIYINDTRFQSSNMPILFKITMENGLATLVETNGLEHSVDLEKVRMQLSDLIHTLLQKEKKEHPENYFYKQ